MFEIYDKKIDNYFKQLYLEYKEIKTNEKNIIFLKKFY